ncbi:GntR family transcriptional regulator [Streptomyces sp. 35G-GA-8]|uniref:GntR family transcriptional regulator n=1 Tax=Streptomyces sp. 35G-GA-8 TaxID=2939434 RepID=UPI00201EB425|nr:GntR family transcriptional regulator [Streptomyces sp. 35G-GA-8]MCL7382171.1 GntR family transcriptional regulator [Streptomyces sp. 35G-GA-8]
MADRQEAGYLRVAQAIRDRIADGTWPPGHKLPNKPTLATEFGVGENTVRQALEIVLAEGLLESFRGRGRGTYVRAPRERHILPRTLTLTVAPGRLGLAPAGSPTSVEAESTAKVPAPARIAARLGIAAGDLCVRTDYEVLADLRCVLTATSWEPYALTARTPVVLPEGGPLAGRGVAERMAQIGITVARATEVPRPVQLDRETAQLLGTSPGAQAVLIERTHYDTGGRPVETADILVPAERWDITYDIPLGPVPRT